MAKGEIVKIEGVKIVETSTVPTEDVLFFNPQGFYRTTSQPQIMNILTLYKCEKHNYESGKNPCPLAASGDCE